MVDDIFTPEDEADLPATKALFQQLIEDVAIDSRQAIHPVFRIPPLVPAVRNVSGSVGLIERWSNHADQQERLEALSR